MRKYIRISWFSNVYVTFKNINHIFHGTLRWDAKFNCLKSKSYFKLASDLTCSLGYKVATNNFMSFRERLFLEQGCLQSSGQTVFLIQKIHVPKFDFQISTYLNHLFCSFAHRFCSFWKFQWFLYGSESFKVVLFLSIIDFEPTNLRLSDRTRRKTARRRRAGCFCTRSNGLRWLSGGAKEYPTVSGSVAKRPRSLRPLQERKSSVLMLMIVIFRLRAHGDRSQNCVSYTESCSSDVRTRFWQILPHANDSRVALHDGLCIESSLRAVWRETLFWLLLSPSDRSRKMTIMMIKTDSFRSWSDRRDPGRFATLPETVGCSWAATEIQRSSFDRKQEQKPIF